VEYIRGIKKTSVRKSLSNTLYNIAIINPRVPNEPFKKLRDESNRIHDKEYVYRIPKSTPNTLESILNNANPDNILTKLYTIFPPLRLQDWYTLNFQSGDNYINSEEIFLSDYKTKESHGDRIIIIPKSFKVDPEGVGPFLTNTNGDRYTQSALSKKFKRLFGVSQSLFRRIYITEMLHYIDKNLPLSEQVSFRKAFATILGHNIRTQEFVYNSSRYDNRIQYSSNEFMTKIYNNLMKCMPF